MTPELVEAQRRLEVITAALAEATRGRDLAVLVEYRSGATPREIAVKLSLRTPTITATLRRVMPAVDTKQLSLFEHAEQLPVLLAEREKAAQATLWGRSTYSPTYPTIPLPCCPGRSPRRPPTARTTGGPLCPLIAVRLERPPRPSGRRPRRLGKRS